MNLFTMLKPDRLSVSVSKKGVLAVQREIMLQNILNVLLGLYAVGYTSVLLFVPHVFRSGNTWIYLAGLFVVAIVTIVRKIPYVLRAGLLVVMLQLLGGAALLSYGLSGTGPVFLFASIIVANLLFNPRAGLVFTLLAFGAIAGIGWAMVSGRIPQPPVDVQANSGDISQWVTVGLVLLFVTGITASSLYVIIRGINSALLQQDALTKALRAEQASLERRVEERSADLKQRIEQFEVASQIAREISGETNLENLLVNAVNRIRDRFGFYHVGVFVNDERNEYAVLRAATGEAGRAMLERNHRLKIGEIGLVGIAASRGEARIALNVEGDMIHYKNPLLPETRSEIALPLRTGDQTIGVLDVQSVVENAFTQDDVRILQTIADQLAVALQKTKLVEDLQRSLEELEASTKAATQKAWRMHLRNTRQHLAYRYHDSRLDDDEVIESEQAREALATGKPILRTTGTDEQGRPYTVYAVPIKLRNQVLGVVDIRFASTNVSPDLISLIESTVSRLAVSLENARLMEEIRFRAERERLVSEISSKVRSASDVDSVLRTAIQEIGKSLGVAEVMVQLRKET